MTARDVDAAVARLAARQHSLFTTAQVLALGASRSMIQRRVASGRWTVEGPGVYGLAGAVNTWPRRLMVAHLDLGARSIVSHRSAAVLHRFPGARPGAPELTVPRSGGRSRRWRVHECEVPRKDRATVEHLPVTSVARTVLDLASVADAGMLAGVVENLLSDGRLALGPFSAQVMENRRSGRRGSAALASLIERLGPGYVAPESELEARLFAVLRAGGLPDPVRQHPLPSLTGSGRVDAAYPEVRLILEADGRRWHTRVDDFERDRRRDIGAGLLGWRVVRFVWGDLVDRPAWVQGVVAHHLRSAADPGSCGRTSRIPGGSAA